MSKNLVKKEQLDLKISDPFSISFFDHTKIRSQNTVQEKRNLQPKETFHYKVVPFLIAFVLFELLVFSRAFEKFSTFAN